MNVKYLSVVFIFLLIAVPGYSIDYGTDFSSLIGVKKDGAEIKYAVFWVGAWIDNYGWGAYEETLEKAKRENVTPVIIWFYWGDQISPANVESENVYDDIHDVTKSKTRWYSMANELADITQKHMGDKPVIIVVENEFNKNGIENYPKFNDYLIEHGEIFRSKLNVTLVAGFGDWYHQGWLNFRRTVDSYDMVGFQMMRGSTRNSLSEFQSVPYSISYTTKFIKTNFDKPSILYDLAISSYPEPEYELWQKETLEGIFSRVEEYENNGLKIIIYREIVDNKQMSENEYFGKAERHWGLKRSATDEKSSYDIFIRASSEPVFTILTASETFSRVQPVAQGSVELVTQDHRTPFPTNSQAGMLVAEKSALVKLFYYDITKDGIYVGGLLAAVKELNLVLEFVYKLLEPNKI